MRVDGAILRNVGISTDTGLNVSLGVPFAAAAGGLDDRFSRAWLIHGADDNVLWLQHAGRSRIANDLLRKMAARAVYFCVYGNSFDTAKWMAEIAPRPLVIIAAKDDERVPSSARQGFISAAEDENVTFIWTDGQHVGPGRNDELDQLVGLIVGRVNAISGSADQ